MVSTTEASRKQESRKPADNKSLDVGKVVDKVPTIFRCNAIMISGDPSAEASSSSESNTSDELYTHRVRGAVSSSKCFLVLHSVRLGLKGRNGARGN